MLCIFLALKGKAPSFIFSNKHSFPSQVDLKHLEASLIIHTGDSYLEPSKNERTASFWVIPFVLQYTLLPYPKETKCLWFLNLLPTESSRWLWDNLVSQDGFWDLPLLNPVAAKY